MFLDETGNLGSETNARQKKHCREAERDAQCYKYNMIVDVGVGKTLRATACTSSIASL